MVGGRRLKGRGPRRSVPHQPLTLNHQPLTINHLWKDRRCTRATNPRTTTRPPEPTPTDTPTDRGGRTPTLMLRDTATTLYTTTAAASSAGCAARSPTRTTSPTWWMT